MRARRDRSRVERLAEPDNRDDRENEDSSHELTDEERAAIAKLVGMGMEPDTARRLVCQFGIPQGPTPPVGTVEVTFVPGFPASRARRHGDG